MVTFSVGRANPRPWLAFRTMASSLGELTLVLEILTLRQESISIPSRLVSILRLSMVRLSTPVTRIPKCPAVKTEKSRRVTLWHSFRATEPSLVSGTTLAELGGDWALDLNGKQMTTPLKSWEELSG